MIISMSWTGEVADVFANCRRLVFVIAGAGSLAGCVSSFEKAPEQLAVQRLPPLAQPPDFTALPPQAGDARPTRKALLGETLDVLLARPSRRSKLEKYIIQRAGRAAPGIRSSIGDFETSTVAKGRVTQAILAAPQGDGQAAQALVKGKNIARRFRPACAHRMPESEMQSPMCGP